MEYEISSELRKIIHKLYKKDFAIYKKLKTKIKEIINSKNINNYKNLRHPLNEFKRVHITEQFVLIFKINKISNRVFFVYFDHRKNVYKNVKINYNYTSYEDNLFLKSSLSNLYLYN